MAVPLPHPVTVIHGIGGHATPPQTGLLIEWRQRVDRAGRPQWYGHVLVAEPEREGGWIIRLRWFWSPYVRPFDKKAI